MSDDTICEIQNSNAAFLGREKILGLFEKRLQAFLKGYRQNVALIGPRSVGKSFLLLKFLRTLNAPEIIPVYIDLAREPFDFFAQKFMGALIASFLRAKGEVLSLEFKDLIDKSRRWIPGTLRKMAAVKRALGKEDPNALFREMLALTETLREESGKKLFLIFDNIDLLEEILPRDPFKDFGKAIMLQKDTLYFVITNRMMHGREIFREKLSLLFGNFEMVELEAFDFPTCDSIFLRELSGVHIDGPMKKFLMELTDGHPYFFNILVERIRRIVQSLNAAALTEDIVIDAIHEELYRPEGILNRYFLTLLKDLGKGRSFHVAMKVLLAVSLGFRKVHPIVKYLGGRLADIQNTLARLVDEEIIEKKGSFFTYRFPLFSFWLRSVYQKRDEWNFLFDSDLPHKAFRDDLKMLIRLREEEEKKELSKRMEELFRQFRNDAVELDSKKLKCPHFSEVLFKPSNGRVFPVEARSEDVRWLCQVAYKKVCEEDVRMFIQDIERLRKKVQRKILITLEGIELNAKLLAKESNIILWGLRNVNSLFEIYGKPKVIL